MPVFGFLPLFVFSPLHSIFCLIYLCTFFLQMLLCARKEDKAFRILHYCGREFWVFSSHTTIYVCLGADIAANAGAHQRLIQALRLRRYRSRSHALAIWAITSPDYRRRRSRRGCSPNYPLMLSCFRLPAMDNYCLSSRSARHELSEVAILRPQSSGLDQRHLAIHDRNGP
jgi:hypothetical protein